MKNVTNILIVALLVGACKTNDKKAAHINELTYEQKDLIRKDSTNYTTIQWLDSTAQSLPDIKEGKILEVKYRFKNTGKKNLIILNASASCGCTVPEKPDAPILPGAEGIIKAKFDSRDRAGLAQKHIYVDANTFPTTNHELSFKVNVIK